jgi:hypothetical protein
MNVRLLRKVKDHILAEAQHFDMGFWVNSGEHPPRRKEQTCGTTCCIAGWANAMTISPRAYKKLTVDQYQHKIYGSRDNAAISLGLDDSQARKLFYTPDWPYEFQHRLEQHKPGTKAYAKVAAERIEHFIATNGSE